MNELNAAVITAVAHGFTETLLRNGIKQEWLTDNDARVVLQVATDLYRAKKPINRFSLLTGAWGNLANAQEVKHLFSLNGTGEVDPQTVAIKCRNDYLRRNALASAAQITRLAKDKPNEVSAWFPKMAQDALAISRTGMAYDPRPSAHKGSIVSPVMFRSRLETLNKLFKGKADDSGGYREGWWSVWLGITGMGKSTIFYTMACDGIYFGQRVSFIAKENQSQVRARILWALTYLTQKEINNGVAIEQSPMFEPNGQPLMAIDANGQPIGEWYKQDVRQFILESWEHKIEHCLKLYDWSWFNGNGLDAIIAADDPALIFADYIGPEDVQGTQDVKLGLGKIAAGCEDRAHKHSKHIHGSFQVANDEINKYRRNKKHIIPGPYGSGMVSQTADQVAQTRIDDEPNKQHIYKTKCRASDAFQEYTLGYDPSRWIFVDPPKEVTISLVGL